MRHKFGEAVREARTQKQWSQRELADKLVGVKLDPTAITRIENGSRDVKLAEAVVLCQTLDIWIEDAVSFDHDPLERFDEYIGIVRRALLMSRKSMVKALIAVDMAMDVPLGEDDDHRILAAHEAETFAELWEKVLRSTRESWGREDSDGRVLERPYMDEVDERLKRLLVSLPGDGILKSEEDFYPEHPKAVGENGVDS